MKQPETETTRPHDAHTFLLELASNRDPESIPYINSELINLSQRHGLTGLLVALLRESGLDIPDQLRAFHGRNVSRSEVMLRHLRLVLSTLDEAGIPASVVKGPDVGQWAYQSLDERPFTDIDLVVPAEHVDEAFTLIAQEPGALTVTTKRAKADKHDIAFGDSTGVEFSIDVHWDLFSYTQLEGAANGAITDAWSRANRVRDRLGPRWILPDDARLAFLASHAVLDHRFRLILFSDLARIATVEIDWERLLTFARQWNLRSLLWTALYITQVHLEAPIPDRVLSVLWVGSLPTRAIERLVSEVDLVSFDGHRSHPLNLAMVLLHDSRLVRSRRMLRAPFAVRDWQRRVTHMSRGETLSRALIVVTTSRRRGAEVFGSVLADRLRERGWHVDVISLFSHPGPTIDATTLREGIPWTPLNFRVVLALWREVRRLRPQVVLANGSATLKYVAAALALTKDRPAFAYSSIGQPSFWMERARLRGVHRLLHRRPDAIGAVSAATSQELEHLLGVPGDRIHPVETGVGEAMFAVEGLRPHDGFHVVVVGALSPEKAPEVAIDVFAELDPELVPSLRLVGEGPMYEELSNRVVALDCREDVQLVGSVEDVTLQLTWADVLLLTSRTEGLPGAVIEAAAAGRPAVVFDVGGASETVVDGETGFVVPAGDIPAAAERLTRLAKDEELRMKMGSAARQFALRRFTMSHAVDRYVGLLERAWRTRRPGRSR